VLKKIKRFFISNYAKNILNSRKNLIIVTKNKETKDVNKAFLDFFGFKSLKEFKKKHKCICELFVKENGYLAGEEWIDKLLNNPDIQYKIKIIKNNQEYIFKVEAVKFTGKVIVTLTDITQLIKQEEELKEVNKLLSQYKRAVDEFLIVSKTDTKGIITYVNKSFCNISGYSEDELIGKPHNIVRHPDMPKEAFKDMWDTIKRGEIWRGFIKNRKKDGGFYWVDSGIMPIKNSKGEIVEYIALRNDITLLIEAKKKAQEAEKAKGIFLANMSHEIRTPLNAILGFTQLLETKEDLDKDVQKYIRIINSSANTLLKVINDILDISKIESGDISIEEIEFNPNKVFNDIAALFLAKTKEKNINYKINIDKLPECIKSDEHRLKQVIANLLGNAIKFTPENGEIVLSVTNIEDNEKIKLKFSVKDNGIGIPKDKQKEIFKAFSQADGSIIRKFGGTGLGLTISSKIVQKLGGEIKVKSEEGKGSEFYFTLEFEKCNKTDEEIKKEDKNIAYKAKILIAEDDIFNQELIKAILGEWDIDFTIVSNGKEAVENVKNNEYDFIFLDINMPEMNGVDAVKEIKKLTTDIPVIAMTANAFREDVESYFKAGFDDYISKPIKLEELQRVFNKYSQRKIKKDNYMTSLQKKLKLDKSILKNLLEVYFTTVKEDLEKLENFINDKNFNEMANFAHKIKGSSLNLRVDGIAKIAYEIEESSKKRVEIDYKEKLKTLKKLINEIEKETI